MSAGAATSTTGPALHACADGRGAALEGLDFLVVRFHTSTGRVESCSESAGLLLSLFLLRPLAWWGMSYIPCGRASSAWILSSTMGLSSGMIWR